MSDGTDPKVERCARCGCTRKDLVHASATEREKLSAKLQELVSDSNPHEFVVGLDDGVKPF